MNDRDKESRRASINLDIRRKRRQEQGARIRIARVFYIIGIALVLIGIFGRIVAEEGIATESEYDIWEGSFWDVALGWGLITGLAALGLAIFISLFIKG